MDDPKTIRASIVALRPSCISKNSRIIGDWKINNKTTNKIAPISSFDVIFSLLNRYITLPINTIPIPAFDTPATNPSTQII
jgi:hypothetical protein